MPMTEVIIEGKVSKADVYELASIFTEYFSHAVFKLSFDDRIHPLHEGYLELPDLFSILQQQPSIDNLMLDIYNKDYLDNQTSVLCVMTESDAQNNAHATFAHDKITLVVFTDKPQGILQTCLDAAVKIPTFRYMRQLLTQER